MSNILTTNNDVKHSVFFKGSFYRLLVIVLTSFLSINHIQAQTIDNIKSLFSVGKQEEAVQTAIENWKKIRRSPSDQLFVIDLLIDNFKLEKAESYLEETTKRFPRNNNVKEKTPELRAKINRQKLAMKRVNVLSIVDSLRTTYSNAQEIIEKFGAPLGEVKENSFTTPDGFRMWRVEKRDNKQVFTINTLDNDGNTIYSQELSGLPDYGEIMWPFLMPDGQTLYFSFRDTIPESSFEIYATRYSNERGNFLKPQKLPLPFNSNSNDIAFILNEEEDLGCFVTDRSIIKSDSIEQNEKLFTIYFYQPSKTQNASDELSEEQLINLILLKEYEKSTDDNIRNQLKDILTSSETDTSISSTSTVKDGILFYKQDGTEVTVDNSKTDFSPAGKILEQYIKEKESFDRDQKELSKLRETYRQSSTLQRENEKENILFLEKRVVETQKRLYALKQSYLRQTSQ